MFVVCFFSSEACVFFLSVPVFPVYASRFMDSVNYFHLFTIGVYHIRVGVAICRNRSDCPAVSVHF